MDRIRQKQYVHLGQITSSTGALLYCEGTKGTVLFMNQPSSVDLLCKDRDKIIVKSGTFYLRFIKGTKGLFYL